VQVVVSKDCDRKLNPLRAITVLGPSSQSPELPWTLLVASNRVEMWQKARVRQRDNIVSVFYNKRFKHVVIVAVQRMYLWDAHSGTLIKTYDSEFNLTLLR
jgi:hypothetical protein